MTQNRPQRAGSEERGRLDRALLPFAPLLYIAWADGELSAEEAATLRRRLDEAGIEPRITQALAPWLDAGRPPAPAVLEALLRASPGFLSTETLLEQVWDENADPFTNTVTVTVGRLRRKLGDPPVIKTTPGIGYRIA